MPLVIIQIAVTMPQAALEARQHQQIALRQLVVALTYIRTVAHSSGLPVHKHMALVVTLIILVPLMAMVEVQDFKGL